MTSFTSLYILREKRLLRLGRADQNREGRFGTWLNLVFLCSLGLLLVLCSLIIFVIFLSLVLILWNLVLILCYLVLLFAEKGVCGSQTAATCGDAGGKWKVSEESRSTFFVEIDNDF